jgi:hypothetical protein
MFNMPRKNKKNCFHFSRLFLLNNPDIGHCSE